MLKKFKHIVKHAKTVSLSQEEKSEMRSILENHMTENPLGASIGSFSMEKKSLEGSRLADWFRGSFISQKFAPAMTFALILVVLLGGTAYAGESALPGDFLYRVKILNENLASKLAFSREARAQIESKHALARLEEAERLSSQDKLSDEIKKQIVVLFSEATEKVRVSIELLQKEDKESAEKNLALFKEELEFHKSVLVNINPRNTTTASIRATSTSETNNLIDIVDKTITSLKSDGYLNDLLKEEDLRGGSVNRANRLATTTLKKTTPTKSLDIRGEIEATSGVVKSVLATTTNLLVPEEVKKNSQNSTSSAVKNHTSTSWVYLPVEGKATTTINFSTASVKVEATTTIKTPFSGL